MYKGLHDAREGLSKEDAEVVGSMTAMLLLPWDRWVHRRFERATFCDEDALHRDVIIEFTLPDWFHKARKTPKKKAIRQLVPIGFLRKGVLANFSLKNESDELVPMLTAPQNTQVAEAVLWVLAQEALNVDVPDNIKCDIRNLVRERDTEEANAAYFRLFHTHDSAWQIRKKLDRNRNFVNTAGLFRHNFLALTMLNIARHERRVLHLSYEESVWDDDLTGPIRISGPLRTLRRGIGIATGQPRFISFGVRAVSEAESFHIEVNAPDGLMITERASFHYLEDGTSVDTYYAEGSIRRAHFHFSHVLPRSLANVAMYLRPRRSAVVRGAFLTALVALIVTVTIFFRLPTEKNGSETATALLLAVTGVIGLVVVRGGEDEMATSLLFPLRVLASLPIALAVAAALVIVAHPGEMVSRVALGIISFLMAICTFFLARNWYLVRKLQRE